MRRCLLILIVGLTGCSLFGDPDDVTLQPGGDTGLPDVGGNGEDLSEAVDVGDTADAGDIVDAADVGPSECPDADLTNDIENCGACGVRCLNACDEGACDAFIVADQQNFPRGLDVDRNSIYWANEDPGEVWKAGIRGGEPELLAADQTSPLGFNPRFLHLTTTDVITSVENAGTLNHGAPLFRVPKSGGGVATGFARPIADGTEDFTIVGSIVYSAFPRGDVINVSPLNEDSVEPLVDVPGAYSVAHANNRIFFAGSDGVGLVDLGTGTAMMLHESTISSADQVVSDGAEVLIATGTTIYVMDNMGGNLMTLVDGLFGVKRMALTPSHVFFLSGVSTDSGSIFSVARNGMGLTEHVSGISFPRELAADGSQVYCTAAGANRDGQPAAGTGYVVRASY